MMPCLSISRFSIRVYKDVSNTEASLPVMSSGYYSYAFWCGAFAESGLDLIHAGAMMVGEERFCSLERGCKPCPVCHSTVCPLCLP